MLGSYRIAFACSIMVSSFVPQAGYATVDRNKPLQNLRKCQGVSAPEKRLECYDAELRTLEAAIAARAIVVVEREEIARTRRSLFGLTLPRLGLFGGDDKDSDPIDDLQVIETTIVEVRESSVGRWRLTLAEGGTWETTDASRNVFPRKGRPITVKKGGVGGYRAVIGSGPPLSVRRVN